MLNATRAVTRLCPRSSVTRITSCRDRNAVNTSDLLHSGQVYVAAALSRSITSTASNYRPAKRKNNGDGEEGLSSKQAGEVVSAYGYSSLDKPREQHEHAVISAFDLFSIGGMPFVLRNVETT